MKNTIRRTGYFAALFAFAATVGFGIVQLLQVAGILIFPLDAIFIYGFSLCIAIPFLLAILALHYTIPNDKKIWSHAALLFALMYAVYALFVYVVQLGVAIPKTMHGEAATIQPIILTEHSMFWSIDALAYICMGIATLFASFVFGKNSRHKKLKWFLLANACITPVISFVYFYPYFSSSVLMLGLPWIITAPGSMLLLAFYFSKNREAIVVDYEEKELADLIEQ